MHASGLVKEAEVRCEESDNQNQNITTSMQEPSSRGH